VCVIIAAFNAQQTIGRAIGSAQIQDHVREIIVVDDASSDETAAIAHAHDDGTGRLSVLRLARNAGPAAARNAALAQSRQPYFCVLDSDDYFLPGRMARLFAVPPESWDLIADDIVIVPEPLAAQPLTLVADAQHEESLTLDVTTFVTANISNRHQPRGELGFLKPVIRRRFLQERGLRYDSRLRLGEDYALYARALVEGARFRVIPAAGYIAIERPNSLSGAHAVADLANLAAFDAECVAASQQTPRERAAFQQHLTSTLRRLHLRQFLERKKTAGLPDALALLARIPHSVPHIVTEIIRVRTRRLLEHWRSDGAQHQSSQTRFLIGLPGVRLAREHSSDEPRG
jgi:succinoglycan biosynthesis protein ExoU